jgi:DNA (cytosine-5)-methyltransferase 3A
MSMTLSYGFEVGDLVWGKVKSHPWWLGHIFNEAFASSQVRWTRREGHALVAFFGDRSYGWFDPTKLILFDPHFAEKSLIYADESQDLCEGCEACRSTNKA